MKVHEYLECVQNGVTPPEPPDCVTEPYRWGRGDDDWKVREECNSRGMWTIVDAIWTKALADILWGKRVLEIMAGGGWIAKALQEHGLHVLPTDSFDFLETRHEYGPVVPVEALDAQAAILAYGGDSDVLLVSWDPLGSTALLDALPLWGMDKPIVYIGESYGGCTGVEEFWKVFECEELEIPFYAWHGIHDFVSMGLYKP